MSGRSRRRPYVVFAAGAAAVGLMLVGCSGQSFPSSGPAGHAAANQPAVPTPPPSDPPAPPATLAANVARDAAGVPVDTAVKVTAARGMITSVVLHAADGTVVKGSLESGRTAWTAAELLDPGVRYILQAQAVNSDGTLTRATRAFTTTDLSLDQQTYPSVTPEAGDTMGIAMPVIVHFDVPVTDRAEFEKHMLVTSAPAQAGSWHWISSQEVHWRPRTYWQAGTSVRVDLALNGVNAGNGIYGQLDRHIRFSIGKAVLIRPNVATDKMQVLVDGSVVKTIPITGGKGGFLTRSGTKVISEKYRVKRMNSATIGIDPNGPNGYNLAHVRYAMRVTNSGEFLHAAPWSVKAQGRYNVSHGCVGMSTGNAGWLFRIAPIGTPVEATGTKRPIEPDNGWTDWNQTWNQYRAASALK